MHFMIIVADSISKLGVTVERWGLWILTDANGSRHSRTLWKCLCKQLCAWYNVNAKRLRLELAYISANIGQMVTYDTCMCMIDDRNALINVSQLGQDVNGDISWNSVFKQLLNVRCILNRSSQQWCRNNWQTGKKEVYVLCLMPKGRND